ncbi:MAG: dTMP kinase [Spirochaetaceae bacterium]|jgi:dTMP kinase|nr:dTMP kinase [Spirochaetaceae bacterium]
MRIQNFVVFEGGDGSGTTTQIDCLKKRFEADSALPRLYATFEPTGGPIGNLIRLALKGDITLQPETLARLFAADRNEHLYGSAGIMEHHRQGSLVVSDRYALSSLVYQGLTCGRELPRELNASFPVPELLLFFDIEPETACRRMQNRSVKEIYEYLDFQIQVRERYKSLLPWYERNGTAVAVIDGAMPQEEVTEAVWRELQNLPILKSL